MQQADAVWHMGPAHCQEVHAYISNNSAETFGAVAALDGLNNCRTSIFLSKQSVFSVLDWFVDAACLTSRQRNIIKS